ncbi:MAG: bifunctional 4-hydroxy-2-oxoglutarate aldolase/2-dehydro-3-deoxy-phosphogluconate aldolase [Thermodesulfobacteriota bacterium]
MTTFTLTPPVIGILRGVDPGFFAELLPAAFAAGLAAVEVTMNTAGAEKMVAALRTQVPAGRLLGMGTIRDLEEARRAAAAGAMFFVTPNLDLQVIDFARRQNIPVVAGALTPTEVYAAWRAGADMIKVFPCGSLGGPRYIRELRGPFDAIPLAAVGGVTADNLGDYLRAGARAVGVSSSLFGSEALAEKNVDLLTNNVRNFIKRSSIAAGGEQDPSPLPPPSPGRGGTTDS